MTNPLNVNSEIGKLKTVLLHRPGKEIENITPDTLERLLFDDIPYLPVAQKEHDGFAKAMQDRGIETIYLEKLTAEVLHNTELRKQFIITILDESGITVDVIRSALNEYLLSFTPDKMVDEIMTGIRKNQLNIKKHNLKLSEMLKSENHFYIDPMPNLYFTRDPAAVIGKGITINRMYRPARRRESLFMEYILKYHPRFASYQVPIWFNRNCNDHLEGGDLLILSKNTIAIGISERTSAEAIEKLALTIFNKQTDFTKIIAIEIPKKRAFMHLDTVFSMVDYDKFTIHPEIQGTDGKVNIYILEKGDELGYCKIHHSTDLFSTLKSALNISDLAFIPCGGGDPIAAAREQWNDGSNTLAIAPGVVITYNRNYVSNELLRSYGIEVIEIESAELSRGRGGPRCMSMPIVREDI
ncbi:MAG: arcA [Bacillales bacterium]|jgi:arginine deiminase|nr:arcA [Bacillales bacterium]